MKILQKNIFIFTAVFFVSHTFANEAQNESTANPTTQVESTSVPSVLRGLVDQFLSISENLFEKWKEDREHNTKEDTNQKLPPASPTSSASVPPPAPASIEEQIWSQISQITLLNPNDLNRSQIIQKLEDDFNVSIQTDDPSILNKYLLSYLYNYFKWMLPDERADGSIRIRTPYYLHARNRRNRQMVERDGNNIYFSKNAGQKTITKKFHEVMDAFSNTNEVLPDEIQITFEYDNELYSQLNAVFLNSKDIKDFMYLHTGIIFNLEKTDPNYSITQEFTQRELLLILKQFLDLPVHIRDSLALEKIIRMADGYQPPTFGFAIVRGMYLFEEKTIQIFDPAFEPSGDETGEELVLHEIAHALWGKSLWYAFPQHLRDEYESLSWEGNEITGNEFISEYSMENIFEDFAEHFSMYLDNPETLLHKTPGKYQWLKENVFVNTGYFSTPALDNLKIFVHSELEDLNPPYLAVGQSILTVEKGRELGGREPSIVYALHLEGLFDDISGVQSIGLIFKLDDEDNKDYLAVRGQNFRDIYKGARCESTRKCSLFDSNNPGAYSFIRQAKLKNQKPGMYRLERMTVKDYSGNLKMINNPEYFFGQVEFYIPGTKKGQSSRGISHIGKFSEYQEQYIKDNMEVILGSTHTGDTTAVFLLPDVLLPDDEIRSIGILLRGKETERKLRFRTSIEHYDYVLHGFELLDIAIPRRSGFFSVPVLIPAFLPSEEYDVASIEYNVKGGSLNLKCDYECFQFLHTTNQADHTHPEAVAEDIVLSVLQGSNSEGGDTSVLAHIPVTGFEKGIRNNWYQTATLRSPKGDLIDDSSRAVNSKESLQFQFDLKPYHQQGEYILSYIGLTEKHTLVTEGIIGWSIVGEDFETQDRLLRRGIRKTIKIKIPPYQEGEAIH